MFFFKAEYVRFANHFKWNSNLYMIVSCWWLYEKVECAGCFCLIRDGGIQCWLSSIAKRCRLYKPDIPRGLDVRHIVGSGYQKKGEREKEGHL